MRGDDRVQQYLDALDQLSRKALSELRDHVVARYPDVTKLDGRPFVGFQAAKQHLALYIWSDQVIAEVDDLLAGHDTGESTIRFSGEHPLPADVVDVSSTAGQPRSGPPTTLPAEPRRLLRRRSRRHPWDQTTQLLAQLSAVADCLEAGASSQS